MDSSSTISATEKLILKDLQMRTSLTIKSSLDTEMYSYRQYLRMIDKLVEDSILIGWVPVFHPFAGEYKKMVWFFLRTNPRDPQDLDYLQSLGGQLLSLDGIAGPYSLLALMQFNSDKDFNNSLASVDTRFATPNPIYQYIRYQWLEIIAFYKYNGFVIGSEAFSVLPLDQKLKESLYSIGEHRNRPPTVEELAKNFNLSTSTLQKQLKQLEKSQTILGYSIRVNSKLQPPIKAIIQFHIQPKFYADTVTELQGDRYISLLCKIQRESFNLLAVLYTQSMQELNEWITLRYDNEGILDTLTTIILRCLSISSTAKLSFSRV